MTDLSIIPFYNDASRAWGAVKRLLVLPCSIPTVVYLEAAVEGLWTAAQAFNGPDPKHVYHQVFGESLYHDAKQVVRDVKVFGNEDTNPVVRTAFNLADAYDVKAWWLFNFSAAVDGLVDFSTQVRRMSGCGLKHDPRYATGTGYINAIGDDGNFYGDLFSLINGLGQASAGPCGFEIRKGQSGFCAATCGFSDFNGIPVPSSTGVIETGTGTILDLGTNDPTGENAQRQSHTWYQTKNNKDFTLRAQIQSSYTGGDPLPLGEAFRDGDHWHGYMYDPGLA